MWQLRALLWARLAWDTSAGAALFQVSLTLLQGPTSYSRHMLLLVIAGA